MRKPKTLYMGTTKINPSQTVGEIQRLLGQQGAVAILTEYDNGEVSAVSFKIRIEGQEIPFRLPCRWGAILENFKSHKKRRTIRSDWESQSKRVAWRQIFRWIEAQLALVETGMVKTEEVFMPYIQVGINETLFDKLEQKKFKQLEYHA